MEKIFKAGVVGMGGIGNTHCNCIKNDPLAELVAVCDVNKAKADAAAENSAFPRTIPSRICWQLIPKSK